MRLRRRPGGGCVGAGSAHPARFGADAAAARASEPPRAKPGSTARGAGRPAARSCSTLTGSASTISTWCASHRQQGHLEFLAEMGGPCAFTTNESLTLKHQPTTQASGQATGGARSGEHADAQPVQRPVRRGLWVRHHDECPHRPSTCSSRASPNNQAGVVGGEQRVGVVAGEQRQGAVQAGARKGGAGPRPRQLRSSRGRRWRLEAWRAGVAGAAARQSRGWRCGCSR